MLQWLEKQAWESICPCIVLAKPVMLDIIPPHVYLDSIIYLFF